MEYLFRKFPNATSGQLTWAKSRAVCAPALTTVGVKQLSLEKFILYNNVELGKALSNAAPEHNNLSYEQIVLEGWKYDPPKALSDIMESVCGAILVDSGYDYQRTRLIIEKIMEPLLEVLRPKLPRDPTSELMLSLARRSCQRARFEYMRRFVLKYTEPTALCFRKYASQVDQNLRNDAIRFIVHGMIIGAPLRTATGGLSRLKPLLAQRVRKQLEDPDSEFYIEMLCDCRTKAKQEKASSEDVVREELDDEKEEEFAILGDLERRAVDGEFNGANEGANENEKEQDDREYEPHEGDELEREHESEHGQDVQTVIKMLENVEGDTSGAYEAVVDEMEIEDLVVERMLFG